MEGHIVPVIGINSGTVSYTHLDVYKRQVVVLLNYVLSKLLIFKDEQV